MKTLKEYQKFTKGINFCAPEHQVIHLVSGLVAEAGEVAAVFQKFYRDVLSQEDKAEKLDAFMEYHLKDKLKDELGDVLWHISELANLYSLDLEEIFEYNKQKLIKRHRSKE